MGRSAADTPTSPEFLRVSDVDRDRAVDELKKEFVDGRLSHDTFMLRMHAALGAQNSGQLAGLLGDLPPRPSGLGRIRAAVRRAARGSREMLGGGTSGPVPLPWHGQRGDDPSRDIPAPEDDQGVWYAGEPAPPEEHQDWAPARPDRAEQLDRHDRQERHNRPDRLERHDRPDRLERPTAAARQAGSPAPLAFPRGDGATFTIGRHRDCDLHIADMSVSRVHAQLERDAAGWLLSDLGSTNGTRLNGWRVRNPVLLQPGDRIRFGNAEFVIQAPRDAPGDADTGEAPQA